MTPTRTVSSDGPTATLDEVDILAELRHRPSRSPDYEAQNRALAVLAAEMAENPRNMLQRLVELAVELCRADTAGISLLEGDVFRWEAIAGVFADARNGTMPRDASPCGVVIGRDAIQLMNLPDRCFPALLAEPRFVEALLLPFHDHGKPIGTVWIVSHRAERQFDAEDARIVGVLTQYASAAWQLWKQNEVITEQSRRKDQFLATLGHELRNPFAAITTAASLLRQVATDERSIRAVDVISRQSQHVLALAEELLDFARIGSGKLELQKQPVDVRTVVAQIIEDRRAQIESRQQSLKVDLGHEPVVIEADPTRLAQVVSNLVDNAAKYTPEHGQISVAVSSDHEAAVIAVRDSGVGLPADDLKSIFDPFTQLSESRASRGAGLAWGWRSCAP